MFAFSRNFALVFLLFFLPWLALYKTNINTLPIQSEDTLPAMFMPLTIIKEKTFYLDTYYEILRNRYPHPDDKDYQKGLTPFYLKKVQDETGQIHYVSAFTLMAGLLAVPIYFVPLQLQMPVTWENLIILSHIASAAIMALAGAFFYILAKNYFFLNFLHSPLESPHIQKNTQNAQKALLLTVIYLFATINFSLVSQALWQHGTVQLFIILALIFLFKFFATFDAKKGFAPQTVSFRSLYVIFASGLFFGLAILSRPTAALALPFAAILIAGHLYSRGETYSQKNNQRSQNIKKAILNTIKALTTFAIGLIPSIIFFFWYTKTYYQDISNQGYTSQIGSSWQSNIVEGFAGLWISPSKGMLVYSPVLIFGLVGLGIAVAQIKNPKNWDQNLKYVIFGAIVILHTLILGKWKHWYGGWSYGYRMATDILPYLTLLAVPYLQSPLFDKTKKLFGFLLALSILMQVHGLIFFDGIWHAAYDRGFKDTGWLWSLRDSELAFNVRRVFVKFGLLDRACPKCLPGS